MNHDYKCEFPGCTHPLALEGYARPQDLGRHKYFAHGVIGKSATSKERAMARRAKGIKVGKPLGSKTMTVLGNNKIMSKSSRDKIAKAQRARWRAERREARRIARGDGLGRLGLSKRERHDVELLSQATEENHGQNEQQQQLLVIAELFGAFTERITQASKSSRIPHDVITTGIAELFHQTRKRMPYPV